MKKLLRVLGLALLLTLGACGGGQSGGTNGNVPSASKPINSYWTMTSNNYNGSFINLDLSGLSINTNYVNVDNNGNGARIIMVGNSFSGQMLLATGTGCILISSGQDISCTDLLVIGASYSISNNNQLVLHTSESQYWNGSYWTNSSHSFYEYYR